MSQALLIIVSVIALAALCGWMLTLGMLTKALVPMANALKVCQLIVKHEDDKVASLAERVLRKQNPQRQAPADPNRRGDGDAAPANPMAIFGAREASPFMPIMDQPDPEGLEITEA